MNKFLKRYNLPRLNKAEIKETNERITNTKLETVVENSQQTKVWDQMGSQVNSIKNVKS